VNAGRPTFSGQSSDHVFEFPLFVAFDQDQVGELVEHEDQKRNIGSPLLETVVKADKPFLGEHTVAPVHLGDCVSEDPKRGTEIDRDGSPQIGAISYAAEGEHFRVDQRQP
jgi:hypothetical protein